MSMNFETEFVPSQSVDNGSRFKENLGEFTGKKGLSQYRTTSSTSPIAFLTSSPGTDLNHLYIQPHFTTSQTAMKAFMLFSPLIIPITFFRRNNFLVPLQQSS